MKSRLRRSIDKLLLRALGLALLLSITALTLSAEPPAAATSESTASVTIYLVNHGLHSGMILPRELNHEIFDGIGLFTHMREAEYLEIGWGDRHYYMSHAPSFLDGARAILWPTKSVYHFAILPAPPEHYFARRPRIALSLSGKRREAIVERLQDHFEAVAAEIERASLKTGAKFERPLAPSFYGAVGGGFYPAEESYHLFRNCNSYLAGRLRQAGFPISAWFLFTSDQLFRRAEAMVDRIEPTE